MVTEWINAVTGGMEHKKRYSQYKARTERLPANYYMALHALQRYMEFFEPGEGETILLMLESLADLFEESAASGTPIRLIVGDDPVEFADTFLRNYPGGEWIARERKRLSNAIDRAVQEDTREDWKAI